MSTTTVTPARSGTDSRPPSRALLAFGLGVSAVYVGGLVVYGIGPTGDDAEAVASAIESSAGRLRSGVLLVMVAMLLTTYVVAALSRAARPTTAGRLVLPLGAGFALLLAAAFAPMAGAVSVDQDIFDGAVSADAATAALVVMNALMPLASLVAAGFLVAAGASVPLPTWLRVTGYAFAVALLVPPVAWAVLYLVPLWLSVAAVVVARRG